MTSTLIIGCGYLGRRVGSRIVRAGGSVIGTTRSAEKARALDAIGIVPLLVDGLDPDSIGRLPEADRVLYGVATRSMAVEGLRNALGRLEGRAGRLVHVGSTGVYGQCSGEWVDEGSPTEPSQESGRLALELERLARGARGLPVVVLRCAGLYGPGRVIGRAALGRGEPIEADPDGFLNLIQIDDAAEAAVAALDRGEPGSVYLASDDRPVTRREYYDLAARLLGAPGPRFQVIAPGVAAPNKRVSNRRLREGLRVVLTHPDITTGLPASLGD